ncbi:MAG: hypothetical protein ACTSV1_07785 [Alphaproteobacteria bacterium]
MSQRRLIVPLMLMLTLAACATPSAKTTPPKTTVTAPPTVQVQLKSADLIGLDAARLTALFGAPDFRRIDAPAQLWQYRTGVCLLDLFLYPDAEKPDTYVVKHVAARGLADDTISSDVCAMSTANDTDKP